MAKKKAKIKRMRLAEALKWMVEHPRKILRQGTDGFYIAYNGENFVCTEEGDTQDFWDNAEEGYILRSNMSFAMRRVAPKFEDKSLERVIKSFGCQAGRVRDLTEVILKEAGIKV